MSGTVFGNIPIVQVLAILMVMVIIGLVVGPFTVMRICPKCENRTWKYVKKCQYCKKDIDK